MFRFFFSPIPYKAAIILMACFLHLTLSHADSTDMAPRPWTFEAVSWKDEGGKVWEVPFTLPQMEWHTYTSEVIFPDTLQDSLYIVFEGIAWKSELIVNGHYLGFWEDPFKSWVVSLPEGVVRPGKNQVVVKLSYGPRRNWYPTTFCGIHRPVTCMDAEAYANWRKPIMDEVLLADTVALVAPWFRAKGYKFDQIEAALIFRPVMDMRIRTVYFLFEPGKELEQWCKEMGFRRIRKIPPYARASWINAYPYEADQVGFTPPFSLDLKGRRTSTYGNIYLPDEVSDSASTSPISWSLSLIILFPILTVLLLKLLNPGFFSSLKSMLFNPRIFIDNLAEISLGGGGMPFLLVLVRWLAGGLALGVTLYYIADHHLWSWLKPFGRSGLLFQWIYPGNELGTIVLRSLVISGGVIVFKMLARVVLSLGFGERKLNENGLNLDAIGVLPLQLLLILPAALLLFSKPAYESWLLAGGVVLEGGFIVRQIYVTYLGLNRMFAFSTALNFLYICGLIALPYCIWF